MRAFTLTTDHRYYSYPFLFLHSSATTTAANSSSSSSSKSLNLITLSSSTSSFSSAKHLLSPPVLHCSNAVGSSSSDDTDDFDYDEDDDDGYVSISGEDSDVLDEDGVLIEMKKLGRNCRRIRSKIAIEARLDDVWRVLTDYERLAEFIPSLAVSKLVDKQENFARLFQIGQQDLAMGVKINAKATLDCYERDLEVFGCGRRRDIEFKMTEGDFKIFEGKWSIEQVNKGIAKDDNDSSPEEGYETTLSYLVDVKPKLWLPVKLIEGRLLKEIKTNLSCIRDEAKKLIQNGLNSR